MRGPPIPSEAVVENTPVSPIDPVVLVRENILAIARRDLGHVDARRYWRVVSEHAEPWPPHWCGAFVLWCYRQAGLCDWKWKDGIGIAHHLRQLDHEEPQPADLVYFPHFQHHALFDRREDDCIWTIAGNASGIVAGEHLTRAVCECKHGPTAHPTFFSIADVLAGQLREGC